MRIYKNCVEAQDEILRDLVEMGINVQPHSMQDKIVKDDESYATKELQGYNYAIKNFKDISKLENLNLAWASAELMERINPRYVNPGEAWRIRSEVWTEFMHEGKFAYTYNNRIRTQLYPIIEELKKHPYTRQAIINIHNNIMDINNLGGVSRVPCSIIYNFIYREDKLDIHYIMRSCDFITHWANDVYLAIELLKYVAAVTGLPVGKFVHFISSLHIYKRDCEGKNIF